MPTIRHEGWELLAQFDPTLNPRACPILGEALCEPVRELNSQKWSQLHSLRCICMAPYNRCNVFVVGCVMDMDERQIALSVLESLREDLTYARLNNGSRVLDVADFRQYIYEQMSRIR